MEISFYSSAIQPVGLAMCLFAGFQLYRTFKHYSVILVTAGFLIAIITHILVNYCIGVALLTDSLTDYPLLCHPAISFIKGAGYFLIGYGLLQFNEHLKKA